MPYFMIRFSGKGIRVSFDDSDPMIGFFTTRKAKAVSPEEAAHIAQAEVLAEWQTNGEYAPINEGAIPTLRVESIWGLNAIRGIFSRKPAGYSFYRYED